jgi:catechol 2,3-dioxygenase-like lactoylglutathione lyase family enzyme
MLGEGPCATMLPSKDMARARDFYEDKLKLTPQQEMSDGSVMYRCGQGTSFTVFPSTGASDGSFTQIGFWVTDVESEVRDLRSRGVVFEEYDMPDFKTVDSIVQIEGWKGAWLKDPDGNLIAVGEGPAM